MKNYYQSLGIKREASPNEIKKSYRKLAQKFHPDRNDSDDFFEERFKDIQEAYEVLNNVSKKESYDKDYDYFFNTQQNSNHFKSKNENTKYKEPNEVNLKRQKEKIKPKKNTAIIAYLTIIGSVIAIFMNQEENKSEFVSFHIRQALGLFISFFLLGYFVGYADSWTATSAFYIFYFILWIYGFSSALQGQKRLLPLVGTFFQSTFKSL